MLTFIHGIILTDGRKTVSQIRRSTHNPRDLSSMTRFLNESPWCSRRVTDRRHEFIINTMKQARNKQIDKQPTFFIIDDTQAKKHRSTKRMEGLDMHFSHADRKRVWSHSIVTAHIVSGDYSFAWDFRSYYREPYCQKHGLTFKSKNDLAIELIETYKASSDEKVYVLVDSWYMSKKLIEACKAKGFYLIGGLRTNRKIRAKNRKMKISEFAANHLQQSDLRSVTVDDRHYKVYKCKEYCGETEKSTILLSWKDKCDGGKKPFCLLCTDNSLDLVTILQYYDVRWNIETGYRYLKDLLGFNDYQLLSRKGIERFWCMQFLTYNFLEYQRKKWEDGTTLTIGDVVRRIRKDHLGLLVVYAYEQGLTQKPLMEVLKSLKLTA
ncbi:IS701 family transposase [Bacillus aquiflavi]|nr:IS701 family transposase [Bacillus aquiflavi]UAC46949.1 IS701 family transposase [Bacillus aquiflavi]